MQKELTHRFFDSFVRDLSTLGGLPFFTGIIFFTFLISQRQLSKELFFGLILILLVCSVVRLTFFKDRPKKQKYDLNNFLDKIDASSLPSMHSARSFFLAFILSKFFGSLMLFISFTLVAILVCYSRFKLKKHDIKDLAAGLAVAIATYAIIYFIF